MRRGTIRCAAPQAAPAAAPQRPSEAPRAPWRSLGALQPGQRDEALARRPLFDPPTPAASARDPVRGSGVACAHYVRTRDATVWAIVTRDGLPQRALGPLSPADLSSPPVQRVYADGVDATAWDLAADFTPAGTRTWRCIGSRPPEVRRGG